MTVTLTKDEAKLLSKLRLVDSYDKANAIVFIIDNIREGGKFHYLTELRSYRELLTIYYDAITTNDWRVGYDCEYVIKLPSGHYLEDYSTLGNNYKDKLGYSYRLSEYTVRSYSLSYLSIKYKEYKNYIKLLTK